jgi:phage-related protein (TIGR01555 family)
MQFIDGLISTVNALVNRRMGGNAISSNRLEGSVLRGIYKTGLGSKIVRIKAGYALKDTLQFKSIGEGEYYKQAIAASVKQAARFMVGFGRGIIVLHRGDDLSKPLPNLADTRNFKLSVFSGDMVTAVNPSLDLADPRYMQPSFYQVRASTIHHSRVIDFKYILPPELDAANYQYGGMSEFDLIYDQIVNDGKVERASGAIIEKSSNWVYKVSGFKNLMQAKKDSEVINYFTQLEDLRSVHGATILDMEDEVQSINQSLSNLAEIDQITLRRLAMVTGIPLSVLIGENVKGLNSTGDNEKKTFQDTIETIQEDHLITPINELLGKLGMQPAQFKENQGETPQQKIAYDKSVVDIAKVLFDMGRDPALYLREKGLEQADPWVKMWGTNDPD